MSGADLSIDREAVAALAKDAADLRSALEQVSDYARADDLGPQHFGALGVAAGAAFADLREALRGSLERATPGVEAVVGMLAESAQQIVEADDEAARRITAAGER